MTAQAPDKVIYKSEQYAIIGVKGEHLLTPMDFGIVPQMWSTGCYRGYIATYSCLDGGLFLTEMHIGRVGDEGEGWKPIDGVQPETVHIEVVAMRDGKAQHETRTDGKKYRDLKVKTYFSGGILMATGFIQQLYVHMGFGKPYQYKQVRELLFHEGALVKMVDHSDVAAAWRDHVVREQDERQRKFEELENAGLSYEQIMEQLSESSDEEDLAKGIEWRFSLDYKDWF
jgi:hypothetical protein